jgi:hypothetical protein
MMGVEGWKEAALAVSWVMEQLPGIAAQGGSHGQYTHRRPACTRRVGPCLHPAHFSTRPAARRRCRPHHGPTHRCQPAAHSRHPRPGQASSYHRVLSQARWSGLQRAALLLRLLLRPFCPTGRIRLVGDDTVDEHRGKRVYGKGRHRDAVRSSHSYTAFRYGHKGVVLAILVSFPQHQRRNIQPATRSTLVEL